MINTGGRRRAHQERAFRASREAGPIRMKHRARGGTRVETILDQPTPILPCRRSMGLVLKQLRKVWTVGF